MNILTPDTLLDEYHARLKYMLRKATITDEVQAQILALRETNPTAYVRFAGIAYHLNTNQVFVFLMAVMLYASATPDTLIARPDYDPVDMPPDIGTDCPTCGKPTVYNNYCRSCQRRVKG